jgi:dCTP deaminase
VLLSNQGITSAIKAGELDISPWNDELLNPNSYDLTLAPTYRRVRKSSEMLDLCNFEEEYSEEESMGLSGKMVIMPGECILAVTQQCIYLGDCIAAEVSSKSTMGRLFQTIHAGGAGFCDAGFTGHITLEIVNFLPRPVIYRAGQRVAQLSFTRLSSAASPKYNSTGQYSNADSGPIPAKPIKRVS